MSVLILAMLIMPASVTVTYAAELYSSDSQVISFRIKTLPDKTQYSVGETLDATGLVFTAEYDNGNEIEVLPENVIFSQTEFTRAGKKLIVAEYEGLRATFFVDVTDRNPVSVAVYSFPQKLFYVQGEKLDTTGLELMVEYDDSTSRLVVQGYSVSYDFSSAGQKNVTVEYTENEILLTTSFEVSVSEKPVEEIASVFAHSVSGSAGETVSVPFYIEKNKGFMGFALTLDYDAQTFTPVCVNGGEMLSTGSLNDSIGTDEEKLKIVFSGSENVVADGMLFCVDFLIDEKAGGKFVFEISYLQSDTFNEAWQDVRLNCGGFEISVLNQYAEESVRFYSENMNAVSSSEIRVPIKAENALGLDSFFGELVFDKEKLQFDNVEAGNILNGKTPSVIIDSSGNINLKWSGKRVEGDGVLFYINFTVNANAYGESQVEFSCENVDFDSETQKSVLCESFVIEIEKTSGILNNRIHSVQSIKCEENELNVPVCISDNSGIMGFGMTISYDGSSVTPIDLTLGEVLLPGMFEYRIDADNNRIKVIWNHSENITADGVMFSVRFAVNGTEIPETVPMEVTYSREDTYNEDWDYLMLRMDMSEIPVAYMKISISKSTLNTGDKVKLSAVCKVGCNYETLTFSSSNSRVAEISSSGIITAKSGGTTTVSVTDSNGFFEKQVIIRVNYNQASLKIINLSGSNFVKVDWWKKYSSAKINLGYKAYKCNDAAYYVWSSSNSKVKVDENGIVTNTGRLSCSSTITLTAYNDQNQVIARSRITVGFYKFRWQKTNAAI